MIQIYESPASCLNCIVESMSLVNIKSKTTLYMKRYMIQ